MSDVSNLSFKKLIIGTAQFGLDYGVANQLGKTPIDEAEKILNFAFSKGVRMIDTAIAYGESEKVLGEIGISGWNLITKLPPIPTNIRNIDSYIEMQVYESLKRLKVSKIYAMLLHKPLQLLEVNGDKIYNALKKLKDKQIIEHFGISIYKPTELDELIPTMDFDIVQAPYNIFDDRLNTSGWLKTLKNRNINLHARSIFLQGLLLMKNRPRYFSKWEKKFSLFEGWLEKNNLSPLQASLGYAMQNNDIDKLVIGFNNLNQLEDIFNAMKLKYDWQNFPILFSEDENLINPNKWKM